jgi:hypothetical protein
MAIQVGYSLLGGSYEQPREATSLVRAGDHHEARKGLLLGLRWQDWLTQDFVQLPDQNSNLD